MSLKERLIKDTLLYSVANYAAMGIGIVVSVASKAVLGIAGAGYWAILKVFLSYAGLSDLGSKDAMLREVSQASGAGDEERGRRVLGSAFVFLCVTSALFAAGIFVSSAFVADPVLRRSFWVLGFLVAATQLYNFMLTFLRLSKNVANLAFVIVLNISAVGALSLALAWRWGVTGFAAGTLAGTLLSAWIAYARSGMRIRPLWDGGETARLVGIGLPLVLAGYAIDTFLTLDTLMIGKMIGVEALGYYTIGLMSIQQINSLGRFAQIVLVPHAQEKYGKSRLIEDARPLFVRTTGTLVYVLPVVIALVYFAVPVLVHAFIPKFVPGLPSMKILVLGYFFVAVNEMSSTVLFTINRQKDLVPIFAAMIALAGGLNWIFIRRGWGIEGVAAATSVSYFFYFAVLFSYSFRFLMKRKELWLTMLRIAGVFAYFAGAVLLIDRWAVPQAGVYLGAALKFLAFVAVFSPFLFHLEKKEGIVGAVTRLVCRNRRALSGA